VAIAAVAGPVIFGLLNAPRVSAQSPQASGSPQAATVDVAQQTQDAPLQNPSTSVAPPPRIYHVGGDVMAPKLIFAPDPEFSAEAKRAKYQGVCVISTIVDAQGNPYRVQVVRRLGMGLDKKAVEAVKQYKFKPGTLHGRPVAVEVNIEVNFRLY
jgi:TonB family protein